MSPVVTNADPHIHLLNRGILLKNERAILECPPVVTNADPHIHLLTGGILLKNERAILELSLIHIS